MILRKRIYQFVFCQYNSYLQEQFILNVYNCAAVILTKFYRYCQWCQMKNTQGQSLEVIRNCNKIVYYQSHVYFSVCHTNIIGCRGKMLYSRRTTKSSYNRIFTKVTLRDQNFVIRISVFNPETRQIFFHFPYLFL